MKKKLLAISVLAAISSQASAFQFDTSDDWKIRWDNTFKANVVARVNKADKQVTEDSAGWLLARDSDWSVDRSGGGLVSTRIDVLSEMDVIWKNRFGFRVSGSGWYDPQYKSSNNDYPDERNATWQSPSASVGDYSHEAKDWHYAGGEFLDAFVFANFDIGDAAVGVRAGRHTIYWGNSLLGGGAIASIGGAMNAMDFNKGLSVPGSEAKELFMPANKISTVVQLTDNLTLNAYYGLEHTRYRLPETGTFFSPAGALTSDTEYINLGIFGADVLEAPVAMGTHHREDEGSDGDIGFNLQYYVEAWELETSFIYMNYTDKNLHGLHAGFNTGQFLDFQANIAQNPEAQAALSLWQATCGPAGYECPKPMRTQGDNPTPSYVVGESRWLFKDDIDLFGISFAKEIAGVSVGLDLVLRQDAPLAPEFNTSIQRLYDTPDWGVLGLGLPEGEDLAAAFGLGYMPGDYFDYDSDDFLGAEGDIYSVVINGLGLLNNQWGLWDGGQWILEGTFTMLDDCTKNCELMDVRLHEDRVVSYVEGKFDPTWYQVFPGWDMTIPMSVAYQLDGEKNPQTFGGDDERGSASIGVEFLIDQKWIANMKYNTFFGPVDAGTGGLLKDRDNVSMTLKRTF